MKLDEERAEKILRQECKRAQNDEYPDRWKSEIQSLCSMSERTSATYIAAFGTQALAKATDLRAYTLSKDIGDKEGGYSARGFCKRVLAANAPELGIDLGVSGREPLNNQPFFWVTYMDQARDRVKSDAVEAYEKLIDLLRKLDDVSVEQKAREILRAFLRLRLKEDYAPPDVDGSRVSLKRLSSLAKRFVSTKSEGGRRAQATAAAFFDGAYGSDSVATDRINDPDRKFPGDVAVIPEGGSEEPVCVVEVRDKPVDTSDLYHFVQKVSNSGIQRSIVLAMSSQQDTSLSEKIEGPSELRTYASRKDVAFRLYMNWHRLGEDLLFWIAGRPSVYAGEVYESLPTRATELEVSREAIEWWAEAGRDLAESGGDNDHDSGDGREADSSTNYQRSLFNE
jgi:hypothetical protein